jgi:hypothetical protein
MRSNGTGALAVSGWVCRLSLAVAWSGLFWHSADYYFLPLIKCVAHAQQWDRSSRRVWLGLQAEPGSGLVWADGQRVMAYPASSRLFVWESR